MTTDLPSLDSADRSAHARRIWHALVTAVDEAEPVVPLGRALALYRFYPTPSVQDRVSDLGYLVDASLNQVTHDLWPAFEQGGRRGKYDPDDEVSRHLLTFGQRMTQHLRNTGNAVCLRRGNPTRPSRWWIRRDWFETRPFRFEVTPFGPDEPDIPEAELVRLREENDTLRGRVQDLTRQLDRARATLRAITD